VNLDD